MEAKEGIWKISKGKNDRVYIECSEAGLIGNPSELLTSNGLLIYGYENLRDLAVAILKYEKEKQKKESIMGRVESAEPFIGI